MRDKAPAKASFNTLVIVSEAGYKTGNQYGVPYACYFIHL